MNWVWAGIGWLGASFLVALILGELMAPRTELERRLDDEAQVAFLRECNRKARAKLDELDELKAKISGSEA